MPVDIHQLIDTTLSRPSRYLGNERGAIHKEWQSAMIRWVLTYPEVYEVGSSNLGHIILYGILNAQPRQLCDRAYLPAPDLATRLRQTQTPLFAVESKRSLTAFDILGFSLSYELGATNILEMLSLAGIPLTRKQRAEHGAWNVETGSYPLVFAGGQTATGNPEPYADFFDFMALGDGEELLPEIGLVLEEGKANQLSREALLLDLAQVPGVYVPQFYDVDAKGAVHPNRSGVPHQILRRVATPMPAYSIGLVPYVETVHDRLTVEVRRGCTRGCRFCQPGMLTRPARDVEPDQVIDTIERGMRETGYNEFSLLSLSCSDYLALPSVGLEIRNRLKQDNISLSLPSQRVDRFDENISNIIGGTRKSGLTFAPEAGTQRMRDIINKGLTNEELLRGVKTAYEQGWERVKLYFMIGLPGETDADVIGIAETLRWLKQECRGSRRKPLNFNVTISNFTPKPHTPFQWHSVSTSEFERKQALLKEEFRGIRGLKANFTDVRISAMEDFLGRGDRRLSNVIKQAWERGAGMDAWWESLDDAFAAWSAAIETSGLTWKYRQIEQGEWNLFQPENQAGSNSVATSSPSSPDRSDGLASIANGANDPSENGTASTRSPENLNFSLPWDHINTGITKQWLKDDLARALEAATVPDCAFDGCSHCGVCGTDLGHNVVIPPPPLPTFDGKFVPNQNRQQRIRVRLGKLRSMALLGHLDLVRLLDRAIRRAALPISFTGGYHPGPRISPANALPLGATSSGEVIDFDLTETVSPEVFKHRLQEQLPSELPIYNAEAITTTTRSATQLLEKAEYFIWVHVTNETENLTPGTATNNPTPGNSTTATQWQRWIDLLLEAKELWIEKTTKSGKQQQINMRDRLFELELIPHHQIEAMHTWGQIVPPSLHQSIHKLASEADPVVIRYIGSCCNDGSLLRPSHLLTLLEQASRTTMHLVHIHRQQLFLNLDKM